MTSRCLVVDTSVPSMSKSGSTLVKVEIRGKEKHGPLTAFIPVSPVWPPQPTTLASYCHERDERRSTSLCQLTALNFNLSITPTIFDSYHIAKNLQYCNIYLSLTCQLQAPSTLLATPFLCLIYLRHRLLKLLMHQAHSSCSYNSTSS